MRSHRRARTVEMARVIHWAGDGSPDEHELRRQLIAEGLEPYAWSNGPFATYGEHRHTYKKVLVVIRGSISFKLSEQGKTLELQPGDRLELPAYVAHTAQVGPDGVACLEAPGS